MACLLYIATTLVCLVVVRRRVAISGRASLLLILLPLLFVGGAVVRDRVYGPAEEAFHSVPLVGYADQYPLGERHAGILSDLWVALMPWRAAVRFDLAQGEWPLLNPFILGGDVLAAAAQPAPYHPIQLLALALPLASSLGYLAACTLFLAALGTFLFCRGLGSGELGALLAAAGFALSDFEGFWVGWSVGLTVATLPWVLWGARRVARGEGRGGVLISAVAAAILAGHPESLAHVMLIGVVYGAFVLLETAGWRQRLLHASHAVAACGIGVLLCSFFLLPVLDALDQSAEARGRSSVHGGVSRPAPWGEAVGLAVRNVLPFEFGLFGVYELPGVVPAEPVAGYAGSLLLAPALFGLWRGAPRDRFALGGLGLFCALISSGWPGATQLLNRIPPFGMALNRRLAFGVAFVVAVLAGLALDAVEREVGRRRQAVMVATGTFVACGLLLATTWSGMSSSGLPTSFLLPRAAVWLGVPALGLLVLVRARQDHLGAWLIMLLAGQRAVEMGGYYPSLDRAAFFPRVPPIAALPVADEPYRVVGQSFALIPNTSAMWGLEDVRGYQAVHLERWLHLEGLWSVKQVPSFNRVDDLTSPILSFLNVRFAFVGPEPSPPPGWKRFGRFPRCQIFENTRVLPRAFVPRRVRLGGEDIAVYREIVQETDFATRAWVSDPARATGEPHGVPNGPGRISALRHHGSGLEFEADMVAHGWVIVSQTAWRGWHARVDGTEVPLRFGNHAFLALRIPAGRHQVRLYYRPASFVVGLWVSASTLVALFAAAQIARRKSRARPR